MPNLTEERLQISNEFEQKWNFPHVIGAIDGKHINVQAPINSATEYYNYKGFFSIILIGVVDANYNFIFADVGCQGQISDGGVFKNTILYKQLENRTLDLHSPKPAQIPYCVDVSYMMLGDKAFSLNDYTMKPFDGNPVSGSPEHIFNYRHSRARRVVENAFGILGTIFRVLRKPMLLDPQTASKVTMTTVYLHNFLHSSSSSGTYQTPGMVDVDTLGIITEGTWRTDQPTVSFQSLPSIPWRSAESAKIIRTHLADYFVFAMANPILMKLQRIGTKGYLLSWKLCPKLHLVYPYPSRTLNVDTQTILIHISRQCLKIFFYVSTSQFFYIFMTDLITINKELAILFSSCFHVMARKNVRLCTIHFEIKKIYINYN